MKKLLVFALLVLPMTIFGQTQSQMNAQASKDYAKADKELNVVYQQVMKKYVKNTLFAKYMKTAQQRWIEFRDAEFKAAMPHFEQGNTYYGTMFSLEKSTFYKGLTVERTKTLKKILKDGPK